MSDPPVNFIRVPVFLWRNVILQLRRRGQGNRESGAFLLGSINGSCGRVMTFICYDALDPAAYQNGGIAFHAAGYAALWKFSRNTKQQVLADVHTHPGNWIGQSPTDRQNPMLPVVGHTAIILPNYGAARWWSIKTIGVYEYLGNFKWRSHGGAGKRRRMRLVLW